MLRGECVRLGGEGGRGGGPPLGTGFHPVLPLGKSSFHEKVEEEVDIAASSGLSSSTILAKCIVLVERVMGNGLSPLPSDSLRATSRDTLRAKE